MIPKKKKQKGELEGEAGKLEFVCEGWRGGGVGGQVLEVVLCMCSNRGLLSGFSRDGASARRKRKEKRLGVSLNHPPPTTTTTPHLGFLSASPASLQLPCLPDWCLKFPLDTEPAALRPRFSSLTSPLRSAPAPRVRQPGCNGVRSRRFPPPPPPTPHPPTPTTSRVSVSCSSVTLP